MIKKVLWMLALGVVGGWYAGIISLSSSNDVYGISVNVGKVIEFIDEVRRDG